jgi:serine O-acetyltransferase
VVIGSNAFITKSISAGTRVSIKNQELQFKTGMKAPIQRELEEDENWYYTI